MSSILNSCSISLLLSPYFSRLRGMLQGFEVLRNSLMGFPLPSETQSIALSGKPLRFSPTAFHEGAKKNWNGLLMPSSCLDNLHHWLRTGLIHLGPLSRHSLNASALNRTPKKLRKSEMGLGSNTTGIISAFTLGASWIKSALVATCCHRASPAHLRAQEKRTLKIGDGVVSTDTQHSAWKAPFVLSMPGAHEYLPGALGTP